MTLPDLKLCMTYPRMTVRMLAVMFYMATLKGQQDARLGVIAHNIDVPKPAISRAFDALCELKMIKRVRNEDDRRDMYAVLTDKGREFVQHLTKGN
jgi:DNA-binding MarR family transcriptional regulator